VTGGSPVVNVALSMYSGWPLVAWTQKDAGGAARVYVRYFWSGAWVDFSGSGSGSGLGGSLAGPPGVDWHPTNNDVVVTFADGASPGRVIRTFHSTGGGGFGELPQRTASAGDALTPAAGHDSTGNPLIAWVNLVAGSNSIVVEQYRAGGWNNLSLTTNATATVNPSLARDVDGNVLVAFAGVTANGTGIHVRAYTTGGAWTDLHNADGDLGMSSGTGSTATFPAVGASTRTCVAFVQGTALYLRCHP